MEVILNRGPPKVRLRVAGVQGFRVLGLGLRGLGLGFRPSTALTGFRVESLGFRAVRGGFRIRGLGLGFRVWRGLDKLGHPKSRALNPKS